MMSPVRVRPGLAFHQLGQAEVRDLGRALLGQDDVGRLDVAVDDPALVGVVEGPGQLLDEPRGLARRLGIARELLLEAAARGVFQHQVALPLELADLVDLHEVGVLEPGRGLGLVAEAGGDLGIGVDPGADHLERRPGD